MKFNENSEASEIEIFFNCNFSDSAIWSEKCIEYFEKLTNSEFWTPCRLKILNFDEKNQIHTVELWVKNEENEVKFSKNLVKM